MTRIVIVGAGISGLTAAYRLQQLAPQAEITVLEQRDRVGGNVWTERQEGFQIEAGPNGFRDNKPAMTDLVGELGLADRLVAASEVASRNRYLFLDGKLRKLPGGLLPLVGTDLLSLGGKLNLFAEALRRRRQDPADESIAAFARRRAGAEVAEVFADGVVTGIFAGDPHLLSVRACFPQLVALEEQYGSLFKGMLKTAKRVRMWSLPEGLRSVVEALRDKLTRPPLLGIRVRRIERASGERRPSEAPAWLVHGEGQDCWPADAVLLACPAYQQAAMLADLDAELAERVGGIAYNRIAVVALGYRANLVPHALDGFGYIAPQSSRRDLLGVQWCSSIYAERAPAGMILLRALCGGWHRADVASWSDGRLIEAVRAELKLAMGVTAAPSFEHIIRWDRAIPQYHLGHLERVAWIAERTKQHPGLYLTGNAYHGVALNDCVEQAALAAGRVAGYLRLARPC